MTALALVLVAPAWPIQAAAAAAFGRTMSKRHTANIEKIRRFLPLYFRFVLRLRMALHGSAGAGAT